MARRYSKGASNEVKTEMRHRKQGKHGKDMSRKQTIAIGLNQARRKGKRVPSRRGTRSRRGGGRKMR